MLIVALDVKETHRNNMGCSMRIAQTPSGKWVCVDCGLEILHKRIRVKEAEELTMDKFEEHQAIVLKRAEEGVMTPEEVTPAQAVFCRCSSLPAADRTCFVHGTAIIPEEEE